MANVLLAAGASPAMVSLPNENRPTLKDVAKSLSRD